MGDTGGRRIRAENRRFDVRCQDLRAYKKYNEKTKGSAAFDPSGTKEFNKAQADLVKIALFLYADEKSLVWEALEDLESKMNKLLDERLGKAPNVKAISFASGRTNATPSKETGQDATKHLMTEILGKHELAEGFKAIEVDKEGAFTILEHPAHHGAPLARELPEIFGSPRCPSASHGRSSRAM